jgi:hypothetical protein
MVLRMLAVLVMPTAPELVQGLPVVMARCAQNSRPATIVSRMLAEPVTPIVLLQEPVQLAVTAKPAPSLKPAMMVTRIAAEAAT